MNSSQYCANCALHGWKQLKDKTKLLRCTNCKVVEYCGRDCQREHWKKIHREQCQLFIDSANNHDLGHKEGNCLVCREAAAVGVAKLKKPRNPNYGCIYKEYKIPSNAYHPHTTGQPGDTLEKAILVLWHLLHKCVITRHWVYRKCEDGLKKVFASLMENWISILEYRKVFPYPENVSITSNDKNEFVGELLMIHAKSEAAFIVDPLQLWKIISKINQLIGELYACNTLKALKDPFAGLPDDLKELVTRGLANQVKFLAVANQALDALATKVIPYQELLKIICGGSLHQNCSFCFQEIVVASNFERGNQSVFFAVFTFGMYSCGRGDCNGKSDKLRADCGRFATTMRTLVKERRGNRCDFCLKLPPKNGTSFCARCVTTLYCSETCQKEDWEFHKTFCSEEVVDERKIKFSRGGRKKKAIEGIREMEGIINNLEKSMGSASVKGAFEVVDKFKLKNAKKSEK